jgi:uncharacterized membrane protein
MSESVQRTAKPRIKVVAMMLLLGLLLVFDGFMSCFAGRATKAPEDMSVRVLLYVVAPLFLGLVAVAKWKGSRDHLALLRWSCWILLLVAVILAIIVLPGMHMEWKRP